MSVWVWFPLFLILSVLLAPWLSERLRKRWDVEEMRINAPGEFAELASGVTHYRWFGPEGGPLMVCVHGLTTPCYGYEGLASELAGKGYRVLTYDLYGRGYSDVIDARHDVAFYLTQLDELLAHLEITRCFTLFGYSMGGIVSSAYAAGSPERVNQLVLLAPGGVAPATLSFTGLRKNWPAAFRWITVVLGGYDLRKYIRAEANNGAVRDRQLATTRQRGFWPSVAASATVLETDIKKHHQGIARNGTPVLAIWGARDQVIPPDAVDILKGRIPAAKQIVLEDANHGLTYSHPQEIAGHVLAFLGADGRSGETP